MKRTIAFIMLATGLFGLNYFADHRQPNGRAHVTYKVIEPCPDTPAMMATYKAIDAALPIMTTGYEVAQPGKHPGLPKPRPTAPPSGSPAAGPKMAGMQHKETKRLPFCPPFCREVTMR